MRESGYHERCKSGQTGIRPNGVCVHIESLFCMRLCEGVDERAVTVELGEDAECDEWND